MVLKKITFIIFFTILLGNCFASEVLVHCALEDIDNIEMCKMNKDSNNLFENISKAGIRIDEGFVERGLEIELNEYLVINDFNRAGANPKEGAMGFWIKPLTWEFDSGIAKALVNVSTKQGNGTVDFVRVIFIPKTPEYGINEPSLGFAIGNTGVPQDNNITYVPINNWFDSSKNPNPEWHHIGFTWDDSDRTQTKAFVDFDYKKHVENVYSFHPDLNNFTLLSIGNLGEQISGSWFSAEALIDEVYIYNDQINFEIKKPEISNLDINADTEIMTIIFETNVDTNSAINYWYLGGPSRTQQITNNDDKHFIELDNLESGKTYYYKITACTANGLCDFKNGEMALYVCNPGIVCSDWSDCRIISAKNKQVRDCVDRNDCVDDFNETRDCVAPPCTVNSDCETGEICESKMCRIPPECTKDSDCGRGEECESEECVFVGECTKDSDCDADEECIDKLCEKILECTVDSDCAVDEVCENNECVEAPECTRDTDCEDDEECVSEECKTLTCKSYEIAESHECVNACDGTVCADKCETEEGVCCSNKWNEDFDSCDLDKIDELEEILNDTDSTKGKQLLSKAKTSANLGNLEKAEAEAIVGIYYTKADLALKEGKGTETALLTLEEAEEKINSGKYSEAIQLAQKSESEISIFGGDLLMIVGGAIGLIILITLLAGGVMLFKQYNHQHPKENNAVEKEPEPIEKEKQKNKNAGKGAIERLSTQNNKTPEEKRKTLKEDEEELEKLKAELLAMEDKYKK